MLDSRLFYPCLMIYSHNRHPSHLLMLLRFVMSIYEVEKKPEKKAEVPKIPLLIPKVILGCNASF